MAKKPVFARRVFLKTLKDYWPYIVGLTLAFWTVWTWSADQRKIAEVRLFEARKPFLEYQLGLFKKTAEVVGKMQNLTPTNKEWDRLRDEFFRLRWSELEMVGDPGIRQAMRRVQYALLDVQNEVTEETQHKLRWMIECLADELRLSLERSWGSDGVAVMTASGERRGELPNGCQSGRQPPPPLPMNHRS